MILIADSGSTKTDWALISKDAETIFFTSEGYNPYFISSQYLADSLIQYLPPSLVVEAISSIYFYGAGCFEDKTSIITSGLQQIFKNAKIAVHLDIVGAAHAVLGTNAGFVSILGTGMNTCIFDGNNISQNIDSLGYILGDEGSGASIGKKLLASFIRQEMPKELQDIFIAKYSQNKETVFEKVYNQPFPNRYCASFAPFLLENPDVCPEFKYNLVKGQFNLFFENLVSKYPNYQSLTFNCVGSIGYYFHNILKEVCTEHGMKVGKIRRSPIEGLVEKYK